MNFAPLFSPPDLTRVNPWAVLLMGLSGFFGGYLGVRFAIWMKKK